MERWTDWTGHRRATTTGIRQAFWTVFQVLPFLVLWFLLLLVLTPGTLAVVAESDWWGAAFLWGGALLLRTTIPLLPLWWLTPAGVTEVLGWPAVLGWALMLPVAFVPLLALVQILRVSGVLAVSGLERWIKGPNRR